MINCKITSKKIFDLKADCFVFFLEQDFTFSKELKFIEDNLFSGLRSYIKINKFNGGAKSSLLIPISTDSDITNILLVGLGKHDKKKKSAIENLRRAVGTVIRTAEKRSCRSIAIQMPPFTFFGVKGDYLAKQISSILHIACYHFDSFITDKERKLKHEFDVMLVVKEKDKTSVARGIKQGEVIGNAVNKSRCWVDLPPSKLTPVALADEAKQIAKKQNLKITVFDEKKVNELSMGGLSAVSRGSERDCRFVAVEYRSNKKGAPTIALVGKGVTFDAGGLSLKPAAYMENMKEDMSGAAVVFAAIDALATLKPDVNILAVAALAENLPSGKALMPGDIVTFYNGKTAEVKNTDAEGRLILADALSYVVKHYKPDAIIDLATLTGACQYALGPFFCGMMSKHDDLAQKVQKAAELSGDRVWALPFDDDYKPAIKSSVADICNIGSKQYMAGAITAGFFLQNFVGDVPWVHLDIAGTSFDVPDISYLRQGATGFGVRLLVELILNWK